MNQSDGDAVPIYVVCVYPLRRPFSNKFKWHENRVIV